MIRKVQNKIYGFSENKIEVVDLGNDNPLFCVPLFCKRPLISYHFQFLKFQKNGPPL